MLTVDYLKMASNVFRVDDSFTVLADALLTPLYESIVLTGSSLESLPEDEMAACKTGIQDLLSVTFTVNRNVILRLGALDLAKRFYSKFLLKLHKGNEGAGLDIDPLNVPKPHMVLLITFHLARIQLMDEVESLKYWSMTCFGKQIDMHLVQRQVLQVMDYRTRVSKETIKSFLSHVQSLKSIQIS